MAGKTAILSVKIVSDAKRFQKGMMQAEKTVSRFNSAIGKATKITALTTSLTALAGASLAGVSNLSALAGGIASVGGAALALPGVFAGMAVGLAVMAAALKDMPTVLGDLAPMFGNLQQAISARFWSQAAEPIRDLVQSTYPALLQGTQRVAGELGVMFGVLATSIQSAATDTRLSTLFETVAQSIDTATAAIGPLVSAFTTLGGVGLSYLNPLAEWFVTLAERFDAFTQRAAADGSLNLWIDNGLTSLGLLGSALGSIVAIFAAVSTAASNAGGAGLAQFAGGLERIATIVSGPTFQGALTTVFKGAHESVTGLSTALDPLGALFVQIAPSLASFLALAGQIAGVAISALAPAIGAVVTGLTPLVQQIGGVLLGLLQQLMTWTTQNATQIQAFATAIGSFLVSSLNIVGPLLSGLLSTLLSMAGFVMQNKEAFIGLGVAVMAGVAAFNAMKAVAVIVQTVRTLILGLNTAMAAYRAGMTIATAVQAGFNLALVANPIGIVVVAIAALVAGLVYFVTQTETGRQMWANFTAFLGTAIGGAINGVKSFLSGFGSWFGGIVNGLKSAWSAMWTSAGQFISTALNTARNAVTTFFNLARSGLTAFVSVWASGWNSAKALFSSVMNAGKSLIQGFLSKAESVINRIRSTWQSGFNSVRTLITSVMTTAKTQVQAFLTKASQVVSQIRTAFTTGFNAVRSLVISVIAALLSKFNSFKAGVNQAASVVKSALVGAFTRLKSTASSVIGSIKSGVEGITSKLRGAVDWVRKLTSGFKPPAWLSNALGLGGTGFAVPAVMPTFGAGAAMGGTGAPVAPAIFARTGSGVRRNEHTERPSVTVHQTVNPSPGMDERELATKTSRELMYRIGY